MKCPWFLNLASHELQTPLAIVCGKLDLLMQEDLTESQMRLVSDLYGLAMRMGHLNRNLLLLAIVKAVCDLHGWRVEYVFEGSRHLFVVRFV